MINFADILLLNAMKFRLFITNFRPYYLKFFGVLLPVFFLACTSTGQPPAEPELPLVVSKEEIKPLRSLVDRSLEASLAKKINANKKWARLVSQKKMAVGLVDMSDPYHPKFARINGNQMMYAASLPKIAILLATEDALEKQEIDETEEVLHDMRQMISRSDNAASTRLIDKLGYEKIASVLTDPAYELYDEEYGGGLWVGKRYAKEGKRYPDPMKGISHAATASQVCRFYYLMAYGQLVSFDRSEQMLSMMVDPEIHHKFVNSMDKLAPDAKVYRKSGSWKIYHSDSMLVWDSGWRRYILVALIEDPEGETICRQLVFQVEDVLKAQHHLD